MKSIGTDILSDMKTDILKRKPHLKVCSNHRKDKQTVHRIWNRGMAMQDGRGWYKQHPRGGCSGADHY